MEMDAVGYDAEVRAWIGVRGHGGRGRWRALSEDAEDPGVAVVEGPHGVEEVRDHACALGDGGGGVFVRCFAVSDGEDDVAGGDLRDQGAHGPDFWGGGY